MFQTHKYEKILAIVFLLSLPLTNPWVRGDGVGYYAFARSILFEHRLDFAPDWQHANDSFRLNRVDSRGDVYATEYTQTGHIDNHFSIGPGILWSPFLLAADVVVKIDHAFGGSVAEDGFSYPYTVGMALGTAVYGFLAILLSFKLASKYAGARWAFLAAIGIWFASSLPVYMYFNPSWSHAHSAFVAAVFFWYWDRTREQRTWVQWLVLGAISGLMLDVYYVNAVLLIVPLIESFVRYWEDLKSRQFQQVAKLFLQNAFFTFVIFVVFLPTLLAKKVIYGGYLSFGYTERWYLSSPAILKVAFSSEHGLFSWTPVLLLALCGLVLLRKRDAMMSMYALSAFAIFLYAIGCYDNWAGISSFGSRFFVSLTPIFVLGLAAFLDWLGGAMDEKRATIVARAGLAVLISWNAGLIFQWGTHLIPARGPISWKNAAYNQVAVVPEQVVRTAEAYFLRRKDLMGHIESQDVKGLKSAPAEGTK